MMIIILFIRIYFFSTLCNPITSKMLRFAVTPSGDLWITAFRLLCLCSSVVVTEVRLHPYSIICYIVRMYKKKNGYAYGIFARFRYSESWRFYFFVLYLYVKQGRLRSFFQCNTTCSCAFLQVFKIILYP